MPDWLEDPAFEGIPLFVSRRRLGGYVSTLRAQTRWALDSGAFSEIQQYGRWTISPHEYAAEAVRWQREIGRMD